MSLIDSWTETNDSGDASTLAFTIPRAIPAGTTLVVAVGRGSSGTVTSLSNLRGNTWTLNGAGPHLDGSLNVALATMRVWTPLAAGDSFSVTASASTSRWALAAGVFDDLAFPETTDSSAVVSESATTNTVGPMDVTATETLVLQAVATTAGGAPIVASGNTIAAQDVTAGGAKNRAVALLYKYEAGSSHSSTAGLASSNSSASVGAAYATGVATAPPPPTYAVSIWDGTTETPASLTTWDGTTETPVSAELG